ncbi:MAG: CoA ester lyase [Vannielia sp.]|uniref:HpcH/HpaI aldolase/citrate lyase family protein n=1 Tax=Vannielia sp. TaxID=2813045 RepID=UPI003B8E6959
MSLPRSYLFVPGTRPERFGKAVASGADEVILDLEDAVGPGQKEEARGYITGWLTGGGRGIVRINAADTEWFAQDVEALAKTPCTGVMVPKADPESLTIAARLLPGRALIALVESVAGLAQLRESVRIAGVRRLAFGNLDFASDARILATGPALDPARFEIVLASRLANLPRPIEGVTTALGDAAVLDEDITRARGLGFGAKLCIHPAQVAPVNAGFAPSRAEIEQARRVLAALEESGGSVVELDGKMVDRPLVDQARQILQDAEAEVG